MGWSGRGLWVAGIVIIILVVPLEARAGAGSEAAGVKFLKAPPPFSALSSATFGFEVLEGRNGDSCAECRIDCKLDNYSSSSCESREVTYTGLHDGNHTLEVCINESQGVRCASYNWTIDTVSPTAYVSAASSFTNASNVSVRVSFTEPCTGGGGFRCSVDHCNLLVYGAAHVIPSTLKVLQPDLEFSLIVNISADIQYGRLVLVMDKSFCRDTAGNGFTRTSNSSFVIHFDRRNVFINLTTHIPKKLLQLDGKIRTVEATNNDKNLRIYLSFSEPVLNSSEEILSVLHSSRGLLSPTNRNTLGNRRFGYVVHNISSMAVVTITCQSSSIISRQGTPVSPSEPATFLYDSLRPSVRLSTTSDMRTRKHNIPIFIKFVKPVFDFNSSAILVDGGHIQSFHEISKSIYTIEVHANDGIISVEVPENTTGDVAGNKNLASNRLQVRHYSVPIISSLVSIIATATYAAASIAAALLTVSTASLLSSGAFSRPTAYFISEPSRNLFRIACHIQVFALARWLAVTMPIEYYEFARGIEWSIPYLCLPWETGATNSFMEDSSFPDNTYSRLLGRSKLSNYKPSLGIKGKSEVDNSLYGIPLTPAEYRSFLGNQNMKPMAEFITDSHNSNGWKYFGRNMFWLAVFGGGLVLLHAAVLWTLKFRRKNSEKQKERGALVFPRFEIFLIFLALPCTCQASAAIIRGKTTGGVIVGIVILGISTSLLMSLLLFLSLGITMGKLLQYREVHQEGQKFHWYQEIVRVTLGPGKRGQWTWKGQPNSVYLTKLGPLFEDLRGPPKYMLSQISGGGSQGKRDDRIIASEDETEDAEAPFIQKLFGMLRIYYTFLESIKRVSLGIVAGAYSSNRSSRIPTVIVLSIASFQVFFLALKKPFIKKKVQLVEIISVASEVGIFGACLILRERHFSDTGERRVGFFMLAVFIVSFTAQMINEWYALYRQVLRLSPAKNSFSSGLKIALSGLVLIVLPAMPLTDLNEQLSSMHAEGDTGLTISPSGQTPRSLGTSERSWLRQLRELAKASFSREDAGAPTDPSSSTHQRSGFWTGKKSRSSSVASSADSKAKGESQAKSRGLYKDLEAIFSSK
ncbi:uncharacterized protein LOC103708166 [Phoenix dactylifera]|uniref:Uncharacterized protein LOC103708166 n=1 Tax=Phoenix dactylifera TaxID=42345 RepID=A0A8B7C3U0_PHODC|nr:uncharacterized protein LOC103708166 [Phoenix dactylifera]